MIDKVGGAIIKDKKILVQRKKNNRCECIIPGGKRQNNETDFETLKRELFEELDVELINAEFIGGFDDIAIFSDEPIHIQTYIAEIKGKITCKNEIKEAIWIDKDYFNKGIKIGSILEKFIIPELVKSGLM